MHARWAHTYAKRAHGRRRRLYGQLVMSSTYGRKLALDPQREGVRIEHPNRHKPAVQATRAIVVLLLLASAGLVLLVTVGGWKVLQSAWPVQAIYVAAYLTLAFFAARWNRGVLPVAAVLAVLLGIFALVAGPGWFAREKTGFAQPALNAGLLGVITLLIIPVQMLLVAFAMRGFSQGWNIEVERRDPNAETDLYRDAPPHPA